MISRIHTFLRLPRLTKFLVLQAIFLLPLCQLSVRLFHFKRIIKIFQLCPINSDEVPCQQEVLANKAELIHWVIAKTSILPFPIKPRCLAQALTARLLLHRLGAKTILSIGAIINNEDKNMSAHAWLQCGNIVVTGAEEMDRYRKISSYL